MDKNLLHSSIDKYSRFAFSRSGGKGGQNVNKVNSRVQMFVLFSALEGLNEMERIQARKNLASRINAQGELFVAVQDERTQERNRTIAMLRLESLVVNAAKILPKRKKTKPTTSSKEKRLAGKKLRSAIKQFRGKASLLF